MVFADPYGSVVPSSVHQTVVIVWDTTPKLIPIGRVLYLRGSAFA